MPLAPADAHHLPVLWDGHVRTPDGRPAGGAAVTAYARPPATQLKAGGRLAAVARTVTDVSGRYTLRAAPSGALAALADEAGWVTVMVTATSPSGASLAVDSLAWKPAGAHSARGLGTSAGARGRWVTSPAELFTPEGAYSAGTVKPRLAEAAGEHPTVLTLSKARPARADRFQTTATPPDSTCGVHKSRDVGVHPVQVGEISLHDFWGGEFVYTNTKSTSFEIGFRQDGGGWSVGGSTSMSSEHKMTSMGALPALEYGQWYRYLAHMIFKHFTWICGDGNIGYFYSAETIEPVDWNGGMQQSDMYDEPACSPNRDFHAPVGPHRSLAREEGGSHTMRGAIFVEGFTGSVTSAVSKSVLYRWTNAYDRQRDVCPSDDYIWANTRVTTES